MRKTFLALILSMAFVSSSYTQAQTPPSLMPLPASVHWETGQLVIDRSFSVGISGYADARLQRAIEIFLQNLRRQTGMLPGDMKMVSSPQAVLMIHVEAGNKDVQEPGEDESYSLEVAATGAKLNAGTPLGVMRGLQTLLQLEQTTSEGFAVPAVMIQDKPRFPWRGLMIDVGRHFIPLDVLERNLDGMAAVKLNVLHFHLSDDQGFRVESKKLPKLQRMGSDGLYYTQDEVRELIGYARDRGIRIVPEFDMPGHTTAWFVGYPELASGPGPYQIERLWGILDPAMDPTQERTYKFLDKFIGEMAQLFPDKYFHIGGDEVNGKQWNANLKIQAFMRIHGLKNNKDLQAYFTEHVRRIVTRHGKIMMGWDEILRPELPRDVIVQAWHDQSPVASEVKQGYHGVLSLGYYLDLNWSAAQHYAVDPVDDAANLTGDEKQRILGGEACIWSEYVSPENVDSRIWPRMAAIAERLWSAQDVRDVNSMYARMEATSRWLEWLGLTHNSSYEPMLRRIAGSDHISALRELADVVEPVKDYAREELATTPATSFTPLNRLIDAARPESATARRFADSVTQLLAGNASPQVKDQVRSALSRWQNNQTGVRSLATQSFLVKEVIPLSEDLSAVATAGLQALDYLDRGQRAPEAWKAEQLTLLQQAQKPKAQLLLMIAPSVQRLVEASAGQNATLPDN